MDILSFISGGSNTGEFKPESEAEAFITIMHTIAHADGGTTDSENNQIVNAVLNKKIFAYYDTTQLFELAALNYHKYGASTIQPCVSMISEENKKMVFVYCVDIVLADGTVNTNEAAALSKLATLFGIDEGFVKSCLDVFQAKNYGNK